MLGIRRRIRMARIRRRISMLYFTGVETAGLKSPTIRLVAARVLILLFRISRRIRMVRIRRRIRMLNFTFFETSAGLVVHNRPARLLGYQAPAW
jgi:hypothetical protein